MKTSLLDTDPDLARHLPPDSVRALGASLHAEVVDLDPGPWNPPLVEPERGHLGYLIVSGILVRQITVDGSSSAELLCRGDLIRPWVEDPVSFCEAEWKVVEPARLAELDRNVAVRLCARPELNVAMLDKQMARARSLSINAAIENVRGLDRRLLVLFWHLAERWGRRENGAVIVPLHLTHETLGLLVGARRPSVTTALRSLAEQGAVLRDGEGHWVLHGAPPNPMPS